MCALLFSELRHSPATDPRFQAVHLLEKELECSQPSDSDMFRVDEGLPGQVNMLFNITRIVFILVTISAGTPIFVVLIIPLAMIYIFMQRYYLKTKRELKRLDSTNRSLIFAYFQESLGGITTTRAYG
jgi:ATP-binding cassette subfamily C (CFTR/MRP) protein 1